MTKWVLILATLSTFCACDRTKPGPSIGLSANLTTATSPAALTAFDSMDTRVAVPLLPMMANHQRENMREHLAAVQEIVVGVGGKDFDSIERAARRIGYSEQMGRMCSHMGVGAPGFTEQALQFHHTVDKISVAASVHDMPGVLSALGETLATCTGCHSVFKQRVVDEATWASLTQKAVPHHP